MTSTSKLSLLASPQCPGFLRVAGDFFLIPHSRIIYRSIEKHLQHLEKLQFAHDFHGAVHHGLTLQELPEIFFGENDSLNDFAERHFLLSSASTDFTIAMLDVELIFSQQPFA